MGVGTKGQKRGPKDSPRDWGKKNQKGRGRKGKERGGGAKLLGDEKRFFFFK